MRIISGEELRHTFLEKSFQEAYQNVRGENISRCFAISGGEKNFGSTIPIFVRIFIENGNQSKEKQPYVLSLRFHNFGEIVMMDIISLDRKKHLGIAENHAERMYWVALKTFRNNNTLPGFGVPIFAMGANLKVVSDSAFIPFGQSVDLGGEIIGLDVNEVVKQLAFLGGLSRERNAEGDAFLRKFLDFLSANKRKQDFYEKFVRKFVAGNLNGHNFSALMTMKVFERGLIEGRDDFSEILAEELVAGFAQSCLAIGAEKKKR
ncbi:MAG: hypothetical protein UR66_C0004G0035 [Candidatus Moranbacteria bacterium GW2011_GWE1_35_17]|nr:MAG: hypothetical protein UR66_C0004G0035 [Candidatus Moranbacteria bacterium GW2011_GWE1_35_17]KKP73838.1 MAG: hypothetical protein UR65_C0002G0002 [Candidatus Moranbacteria bacterium GW2011_GWE2_35_164]KKP85120.1 MAG: hypothetical protein UR83_C0004G0008 [Candidatus Moranbacteria bacterium GW2011_GWF2_35_54]